MRADGSFPKHICAKCRGTKEALIEVMAKLQPSDFKFTVEAWGTPWDVYRTPKLGDRPALLAVRLVNGHAELGAIGEEHWDENKMKDALQKAKPN